MFWTHCFSSTLLDNEKMMYRKLSVPTGIKLIESIRTKMWFFFLFLTVIAATAEPRTRLARKMGNKASIAPPQRRSSDWLLVNRKHFFLFTSSQAELLLQKRPPLPRHSANKLQIVESSELLHSKSAFFPCTHDRDSLNCSVEGLNFGNTFSLVTRSRL